MNPSPLPIQTLSYSSEASDPFGQVLPILGWGTIAFGLTRLLSTTFQMLSHVGGAFDTEAMIGIGWCLLGMATSAMIVFGGILLLRRSHHAPATLMTVLITALVMQLLESFHDSMDYYVSARSFGLYSANGILTSLQIYILPVILIMLLKRPALRQALSR